MHNRRYRPLLWALACALLLSTSCGEGGGQVSLTTGTTAEESPDSTTTTTTDEAEARTVHGVDLSALDLPSAEPYEGYSLHEDDTEQVEVEVPDDWSDVDTRVAERDGREVPGIWASTDLESLGSGYTVPGVQVDLRTATAADKLFELLDSDNATDECDGSETFEYDDGLYDGTAELWTGCTESGAALLTLVVHRAGNQYITVEIQMLSDADVDAAARVLETFTAVEPDVGEEWQAVDTEATVTEGETFTVVFESNPSVGDDWRVVTTFDPEVVRFLYEDFESDDPTGEAAGAGGTSFFNFLATGPGTTTLSFENCFRCGPGAEEVTETSSIEMTVEP